MSSLFDDNGAAFSECRKYRFALWRIWDISKPLVMFIGLNPSTANEEVNDNTIKRVRNLSMQFGYGGFYMMNCFPYISTDPNALYDFGNIKENDHWLTRVGSYCHDIVFAWGSFKVIKDKGRDEELKKMFPRAKALKLSKDGSPWHPLYVPKNVQLINFIQ